jgi:hypothetical protein
VNKLQTLKYECILPVSFQRLLMAYSTNSSALNSDPNFTRIVVKKFINFEEQKKLFNEKGWNNELGEIERNLLIQISDVHLGFPLNPRFTEIGTTMTYEPDSKTLKIITKSFDEENSFMPVMREVCPKKGKPTKLMKSYPIFDFFFMRYQHIDEKKVLLSQVHILNLGGWTSGSENLLKNIARDRGEKLLNSIFEMVKDFPEDTTVEKFKEQLNEVDNDGIIVDGLGKLIYELKIDEKNLEFKNLIPK